MVCLLACLLPALPVLAGVAEEFEATLPSGVKAVWDEPKAYHETSPTRERVCLNGLWRWQPATEKGQGVPAGAWGFYKVPACWPGVQDYLQSDYQTLYPHPAWKNVPLGGVRSAWYQRTITIPGNWAGRRIAVDFQYLNSFAAVFIDGREVGPVRFPAGQLEITSAVQPGATYTLTLLVIAMPLKAVIESYQDTNAARERAGTVQRRGLCGDTWLVSEPSGPRLANPRVSTSVRQGEIGFKAEVLGAVGEPRLKLRARILEAGHAVAEFSSAPLPADQVTNRTAGFSASWVAPKLWDIHTPQNQYLAELALLDPEGNVIDVAWPVRFGFREFRVEGRDFYLNGTRLWLSLVPLDNAQVGAALSTYAAARESFRRLQSFGINFVYTHNYGCEPGSHLSFAAILRAADDTGMLVALSQPHFSAYDWKSAGAELTNGYARHAAFYARVAGSHPSVVSYAMSHNATGYNEDMNPSMLGGAANPRDPWSARNAALAVRAERIVKQLDPSRLVYHHSSGSLNGFHTINFYPNFVPIQELDDWWEAWSERGTEPVLLVEYGAPFGWDWTMYRGWFDGQREFGSAAVPWEYCLAEWNAQFLGDAAYALSDREKRNLRWEAQQFRARRGWHRWDYPFPVGDQRLDELHPVQAAYTASNWRAFRTWGLSGNSPWEHHRFWKLREDFQPRRRELPVDWNDLQRPGFSPDFIERTYARFDLAYERADWIPSPTAQALIRNNRPLLGWIAGKPEQFTSKNHIFYPGEWVEKQAIVINNSRRTVSGRISWSGDAGDWQGAAACRLPTGEQFRLPLRWKLAEDLAPGTYRLDARFQFQDGETQDDSFTFRVIPPPPPLGLAAKLALFDPPGETTKLLAALGVPCRAVDASSDLSEADILLIGKGALTVHGTAPALDRVRHGLKVVVFEQTAEALEQRLGFRVAEYGLRQVWPRVPDSPLLAGLEAEVLRDWRGASTLMPPALRYTLSPKYNGAPAVRWCGLEVPRLWRCGNRGNVASVLIEKPSRGDFLPVLEGGFALQYSPLLEYREGGGLVLFCQMDVTGRTASDPAAETLTRNVLRYVGAWKPAPRRSARYLGEPAGREWLRACGIEAASWEGQPPPADEVLVVAPGAALDAAANAAIRGWIGSAGRLLAFGLAEAEAGALLPQPIQIQPGEHIAARFAPFAATSPLAGVSPADIHNRDPRTIPLVKEGLTVFANGVLAATNNLVFCQLRPWEFETSPERFNQRRTFVRTSFAANRLLANLGVSGVTPLLARFANPPAKDTDPANPEANRWLEGLYLTRPLEWDDPYRFFRW